ncbi:MAG: hypothetical protein GY696_19975, partial [Gammaproteobacteria bacterium]|nr:hypothetical protein [Gammaproteobacteria bacterium]
MRTAQGGEEGGRCRHQPCVYHRQETRRGAYASQDDQALASDNQDQRARRRAEKTMVKQANDGDGARKPVQACPELQALCSMRIHELSIYRQRKPPKHMGSLSRGSDPLVRQRYADRLEGFVHSCRRFLGMDVFMDMLGDDLDGDPLWEQWSLILTREEQVHVRMVQASRVCARRSVAAASELLREFVNPAQRGYAAGARMVKKLGDLGVGKEQMDVILDEGASAGDGVYADCMICSVSSLQDQIVALEERLQERLKRIESRYRCEDWSPERTRSPQAGTKKYEDRVGSAVTQTEAAT